MAYHRNSINYILLVLLVLTVIEGSSYFIERYLVGKGIIYEPPVSGDYEEYVAHRDSVLGWPFPASFGRANHDAAGSRIIPAFPDPEDKACASVYGDSFTWGQEVNNESAWSNVLSEQLNCRVSNFGVGGYGTDQAYIRFRRNDHDSAGIVILGHLSENIVRNVNQFRYLIDHGNKFSLKPRFIVDDDGSLKQVPLLSLSAGEYRAMVEDPGKFLEYEYFLPGSSEGIYFAGFPSVLPVVLTLNNFRVRARLSGKSYWDNFYNDVHPSGALPITELIIRSFYEDALKAGRHPVVVIFPMQPDLVEYKNTNRWVYQPLMTKLSESNIKFLNIGNGFIEFLGDRDICELFTICRGGHYNEEGNRVVAGLIKKYLMENHDLELTPDKFM